MFQNTMLKKTATYLINLFNSCSSKNMIILCSLIGVVIQLYIMFFKLNDPADLFWLDPHDYYRIGSELAQGLDYSSIGRENNLYRAPGFPFFLAMLIKIFGNDIIVIRLIFVAFFPLLIVVLFRIGYYFASKEVGKILIVLACVYPFYIYIPITLYPESLLLFLYPVVAMLMLKVKKRYNIFNLLLLGILLSFGIFVRPTTIVLIPTILVYLLFKSKFDRRYICNTIIFILIIPIITVFLWMARNKSVHDVFIFSTGGSINLLIGYNDYADYGNKNGIMVLESLVLRIKQIPTLKQQERMRIMEVKNFIFSNPFKTMQLVFYRCLNLWNPIPVTITKGGMASFKNKLLSGIPFVFYSLLGIIGFILNRNNLFSNCLIVLLILNTVLNGIIVDSVRYRCITDFAIMLMAANVINKINLNLKKRLSVF